MIEREVVGHFAENTAETTLCARDLLADERLTKGKMS
jgi:hypothetical protein